MRHTTAALSLCFLLSSGLAVFADDSGHASIGSLKGEQMQDNGTSGQTTMNHTAGDAKSTPKSGATSEGATGTNGK